jgi:SAM-dependent methyltransferase
MSGQPLPAPDLVKVLRGRACPVCANSDASQVFAAENIDPSLLGSSAFASRKLPEYMHFRLISCPKCELLYANPIPELNALAIAYRDASFDAGKESQYAAQTYASLLERRTPLRANVLDIGAGDGAFLEALLDRGFRDVTGVEPSTAPLEGASARIRPHLRQELFDPEAFGDRKFSIVTCFQTIEHVYDPAELMRGIFRVLEPGGFVFLVFHDSRALSAKLLGTKSPIFDIEHLQLFSQKPSAELLRRAGFTAIGVAPILNVYPLRYWARLFPFPKAIKPAIIAFLRRSFPGSVPIPLPAGNLTAWGSVPR